MMKMKKHITTLFVASALALPGATLAQEIDLDSLAGTNDGDPGWLSLSDRAMGADNFVSAGFAIVDLEDASGTAPQLDNDGELTAWAQGGKRFNNFFSLKAGLDMLGESDQTSDNFGGAHLAARVHLPFETIQLPLRGGSIYASLGGGLVRASSDHSTNSATEFSSYFDVGVEIPVRGRFYADMGYRHYAADFDLVGGGEAEMEFDVMYFGAGFRY
ncbi:outer membrane beta-barrel protein [Aquisalimonas asiatica]|uniref:Outer membrane protein beta-barrel domain-containing protein n=1 Tax=Aquisalimonas asiatica TaxID=406100 RepID=A0A1H8SNR9_9GAMM|nr:outer membrane beta-barrel protein [Aquisalimonas asiatica]SEO80225.1 Outer membrane protein beta-barrel domain-containing protein [Aquisalimonas asiatica]